MNFIAKQFYSSHNGNILTLYIYNIFGIFVKFLIACHIFVEMTNVKAFCTRMLKVYLYVEAYIDLQLVYLCSLKILH
jgi:hypothetical protein